MESRRRSIAKALSWRLMAVIITATVVIVATGELVLSLGISLADTLLKLISYYWHERMWNLIGFGRLKSPSEGG